MARTYLQCSGNNFIWKCEVCAEIFDALVGEVVVVVLPVEGLSAETLRLEGLQKSHDLKIWDWENI